MASNAIVPVVLLVAGLYLAWFAVHYWGSDTKWPSDPVKAILQGNSLPVPSGQVSASGVAQGVEGSSPNPSPGTPTSTGSAIADAALKYVGAGYVWGGNASAPGNWDCSSFVSYVLGNDLHMTLPGGGTFGTAGYPPGSHGPTTLQYLLFGTPVNFGSEAPGDLLVSTVHMGVCIGGGKMVSAQDPALGTGISGYQTGFPGGQPHVRRVSVPETAPNQGQAGAGSSGGHP